MPQGKPHPNKKHHSKGRVPAHQNTTAFRHNPKSKLTDKILKAPNEGLCRRCHDKIEWRKQYRKYKPRTQPGTCNMCKKRNVTAAYHTICSNCASSSTTALDDAISSVGKVSLHLSETEEWNNRNVETTKMTLNNSCFPSQPPAAKIICAMCTKEPALSVVKGEGDAETTTTVEGFGSLRLRVRRTIDRNMTKEQERNRRHREGKSFEDDFELEDYEDGSEDDNEDEDLRIPISDANLVNH